MKKVLCWMAAFALVVTGSFCFAQQAAAEGSIPVYVKVSGKYASLSDPDVELKVPDVQVLEIESDGGWGIGGAVGVHIDQFRVELELAHQINDIDAITIGNIAAVGIPSGDTRITSYMVNAYYDFPINNGWGVYVTGGLGAATTDINIQDVDDSDTNFAFKLGAGVFYAINSNMAVDLGYEYLNVDDVEFDNDNVEISDIYSNNIVVAFRYTF